MPLGAQRADPADVTFAAVLPARQAQRPPSFTIKVTDSAGNQATKQGSITISS